VVCRTRRPKEELVRVVRSPGGAIRLDPAGRADGRGAYLCRLSSCLGAADAGSLARALRVTLEPTDLATLRTEIEREFG
jgi:predicted RNA-binding protein YlxR (DUF448 family)